MELSEFSTIESCRLCTSHSLQKFVDFGNVPLGNNLRKSSEAAKASSRYPLQVNTCPKCGHFQLAHAVSPQVLYANNYTYLSGTGASFREHFKNYADWATQVLRLNKKSFIVDIGSNDGTCLKQFQNKGLKVLGVDPAIEPAKIAKKNGVETIVSFFDLKTARSIRDEYGKADFITSHNVLAHVDDLKETFLAVKFLLKKDGWFCFEVGYFKRVLENTLFDTIYHEHIDYHHASPLVLHLKSLGFDIVEISENDVQGGSIRILCRNSDDGAVQKDAAKFLQDEMKSIIHDRDFVNQWPSNVHKICRNIETTIWGHKRAKKSVAGYGAPTKATLLMDLANLSDKNIDFVVEDNPLKVSRYLPGSGIGIKNPEELLVKKPDVVLIFAWNFADDIIERISDLGLDLDLEVIVPLPELRTTKV